jgi:toxin ParE1/3/4
VPELEWKTPAFADLIALLDYVSDGNPDVTLMVEM